MSAVIGEGHGLAKGNDDVSIAPANDHAVTAGLDPSRVVGKLHDGRAVWRKAEELGRDFRVFPLAVVGAEGLSVTHSQQ